MPEELKRPRIPAPYLVYAIGDIHGHLDLLESLLQAIDADRAAFGDRKIIKIFLGDYIDRGPASCGVIDRVLAESARADQQVIALAGNHERAMLDFLDDPPYGADWMQFGGLNTLRSYGVEPPLRSGSSRIWTVVRDALVAAMPEQHIEFLRGLSLYCQLGDVIFVHAGVRPGIPLASQSPDDLLWIRGEFLNASHPEDQLIVHGHTPSIDVQSAPGRLGIDTGAFATGKLTAVRLDGGDRHFLQATR